MEVTLDIQDQLALVRLDDGKRNAITPDAVARIGAALDEAEAKAKALVIAGRPGSFCAGFDYRTMTAGDPEEIRTLGLGGARLALRLYRLPQPLVAACTGHAFTIGALWLLACDTRIGEDGPFKFGMTETQMGVVLPDWALELLRARIAPTRFVSVVAQSKILDPPAAVEAGFLDTLVPEGQAVDAALEAAAGFARLPLEAYAGNKLSARTAGIEAMARALGV